MSVTNPNNYGVLVDNASYALKWSMLSGLFPRLVTPIANITLAFFLTPQDFGVVAISTLVITFGQIVISLGWQPAVVHAREDVDETASTTFLLSLGASALIYIVLFFGAPYLSVVYDNTDLVVVLRVSSLTLILGALNSVPIALLQRALDNRHLFLVNSCSVIISSTVSIVLALLGFGMWALIWSTLTAELLRTIIVWRFVQWRPRFSFHRAQVIELIRFSSWVILNGIQSWLFLQGDNAIVGATLGTEALGAYALGYNWASLLPGLISATISTVAYPAFCIIQNDPKQVGQSLLRLQVIVAALIVPVCFGISSVSVTAIEIVYGDKWASLGLVLQILAISPGLVNLWSLHSDAYRSIGRPDIDTKLSIVGLLILFPLLLLSGPFGLMAYTVARAVGSLPFIILRMRASSKFFSISVGEQIRSILNPLAGALVMFLLVNRILMGIGSFAGIIGMLKLLVIVLVGMVIYVSWIWVTDRNLLNLIVRSARRVLMANRTSFAHK